VTFVSKIAETAQARRMAKATMETISRSSSGARTCRRRDIMSKAT
jgi:hypothetical protein